MAYLEEEQIRKCSVFLIKKVQNTGCYMAKIRRPFLSKKVEFEFRQFTVTVRRMYFK